MSMPSDTQRSCSPWQVAAFSFLVTLLGMSVVLASAVPWNGLTGGVGLLLATISSALTGCIDALCLAILYQAAFIFFLWFRPIPRSLLSAGAVHLVFASTLAGHAYWLVADGDEKLGSYLPFVGAIVFAAVVLATGAYLFHRWSSSPDEQGSWRFIPGVLAVIGFAIVHSLNATQLAGGYAAVHYAILEVSYAVLFLGLAHLLLAFGLTPTRRLMGIACLPIVLLLGWQVLSTEEAKTARSLVLHHSLLGHANSVANRDAQRTQTGDQDGLFDKDAINRFIKASNLPLLPDSFRLEDYNILLVVSEAVRYDRTSLADPKNKTTPNLRAFAQDETFEFSRAYSPSSATFTSNSAMMVMTYAVAAQLACTNRAWSGALREEADTVPELLARSGWDTFWVGHNYQDVFTSKIVGLGRGFAQTDLIEEKTDADGQDLDARIVDRFQKVLSARENQPKRFFGWVYFGGPHASYLAHYPDMPKATDHDRYLHELRYMDEQFGALIADLKARGLYDRTIIIFTADHGEEFGEHGNRHHQSLYEECIHVPFLVRIPGVNGGRREGLTSTSYLFPWLGLRAQGPLRNTAVQRLQEEVGPVLLATDGAVISEIVGLDKMQTVLLHGKGKIHYDFQSELHQVYDIQKDPAEKSDLASGDGSLARDLRKKMDAYRSVREKLRNYSITEEFAYWAARDAQSAGKHELALRHFDLLHQKTKTFRRSRFAQGWSLLKLGRRDDAIAVWKEAVELEKPFHQTQFNLGFALAKADRCGDAVQHLHQALVLKPSYVEVHHWLDICYRKLGDQTRADKHRRIWINRKR